jgi:hypothetical protein
MAEAPALTPAEFMRLLKEADKSDYIMYMQYLMLTYGTSLHCNRFAIGNSHEYAIARLIRRTGLNVTETQNAARVDQSVEGLGKYSIKYSSGGDIKLHNSNNSSNHDMAIHDTLLVTPKEWWFLRESEMTAHGVDVKSYLKNTGDGLSLKVSVLTALKGAKYPHHFLYDISVDKTKCKHQETSRVFYEATMREIGLSL